VAPGVAEVAATLGADATELAATGGEDYELCACVPAAARATAEEAVDVTWVGEVREGPAGVRLTRNGEAVALEGFQHRSRP
jgi:thiamine-monophosphate kinase